ncbi:hypothetical protein [Vreelandella nanhaiensis]|uniref:Uncharacterized protein n=1 Tax=Vreelandella nanhaiensis TaxID=1258546 RepID=A0A3S0YAQ2_9GAMM|nr:hypothetical protein [Halomonas nanhaiensis]RUR34499.1 hypothetical protein ELY38_02600 [Halomonas nanhaiensis]
MATLTTLATVYGVSAGYLAGFTDDPVPKVSRDDARLSARMAELVERAIEKSSEPVDTMLATRLCQQAIQMLLSGEKDTTILGTLINVAEGRTDDG